MFRICMFFLLATIMSKGIFACPTISNISFKDRVVGVGEQVEIRFTLKPYEEGECPANGKFDYSGKDENGLIVYQNANVNATHSFIATSTVGKFTFRGVAYGVCDDESIRPGPVSGYGELIVVKVVRLVADAEEISPVKFAAVIDEGNKLDVLAVFEPNIDTTIIPKTFVFNGGEASGEVDIRKLDRSEARTFDFRARLGTSSAEASVDIVKIYDIAHCSLGINKDMTFDVTIETRPLGYEKYVTKITNDNETLEFNKENDKWKGKGLKMGYRNNFKVVLELNTETTSKDSYETVSELSIDATNYTANVSWYESNSSIDPFTDKRLVENNDTPPAGRTVAMSGWCTPERIGRHVQANIFTDVEAYIEIWNDNDGMQTSIRLGALTGPGTSGTPAYQNGPVLLSPNVTVGSKWYIRLYIMKCSASSENNGREKFLVKEKTLTGISWDDWQATVQPKLPQ